MKQTILLAAMAALLVGGCATSNDRYSRDSRGQYYYDSEEHPVIVDREGHRTYVRERDDYGRRGSADFQNNMEPRVRGKHAESLGWNTENYYLQRGY